MSCFVTRFTLQRALRQPWSSFTRQLIAPCDYLNTFSLSVPTANPAYQPVATFTRRPLLTCTLPFGITTEIDQDMAGSPSVASNASSGKRKRGGSKFYAVRVGRTPGIYHSWEDCKAQTDGVHAEYKSFPSLTEAEAYVKGSSAPATKSTRATKFYGVAIGHVPGIYTDYSSVQAQVKGFPGAKQKGFSTREEAQAYVDGYKRNSSLPISLRADLSETSSLAADKSSKIGDGAAKKQKKNDHTPIVANGHAQYEPGMGPLPPGAEDGFDPTIKLDPQTGSIRLKTTGELGLTKQHPTGDFSGPIHVYTDGSSLGNGQHGAIGGVGVYFGPNDPRNVSEPLHGERQTNQRAELTAVARALDHVPIDRDVVIHTDSMYSINCLTQWFQKWERNGWKSSSGKAVDNKDLIEPIITRIRERDMCKAKTKFVWIKGHANDPGNVAADDLAVQGSRNSTPTFRSAPQTSSTLNGSKEYDIPSAEPTMEAVSTEENDDDAAEIEGIFADLAAEQSTNRSALSPASQDQVLPLVAVAQLSRAGAKEGQEQLIDIVMSEPLAPVTEAAEVKNRLTEKGDGA